MEFIFVHKRKIRDENQETLRSNVVLGIEKSNMGVYAPISWTLEEFLKKHSRKDISRCYAYNVELMDGRNIFK